MKYVLVTGLLVLALGGGWYAFRYWDVYQACADIREMAEGTEYDSIMDGAVMKQADKAVLGKCEDVLYPIF